MTISQRYYDREFPAPIGKLLGLKLSNAAEGQATIEFEATGATRIRWAP